MNILIWLIVRLTGSYQNIQEIVFFISLHSFLHLRQTHNIPYALLPHSHKVFFSLMCSGHLLPSGQGCDLEDKSEALVWKTSSFSHHNSDAGCVCSLTEVFIDWVFSFPLYCVNMSLMGAACWLLVSYFK